jgi:PAS domain-containing protein
MEDGLRTYQQAVELILMRRWASYVTMPVFIVAPDGTLLYFNDAAALILGRPFDSAGTLLVGDLDETFATASAEGEDLEAEDLPIHVALVRRWPSHGRMRIRALDGVDRVIEVTAMPLVGQGGTFLGAMAVFWEVPAE